MIQDILIVLLIIGFVILVGCFIYISYYLAQTLRAITRLADNWDDTTEGLKNKLKLNLLTAIPAVILALAGKLLRKRG